MPHMLSTQSGSSSCQATWSLRRTPRPPTYASLTLSCKCCVRCSRRFFILPADLEDFKLDLAQNPKTTYIRKPVASSRGRGVRVVTDAHALDAASLNDVILQHYIPDPLLIGGRKFDLRVYVAVMSLDPLRVYVYKEGEGGRLGRPRERPREPGSSTAECLLYCVTQRSSVHTATELSAQYMHSASSHTVTYLKQLTSGPAAVRIPQAWCALPASSTAAASPA